MEEQEAVCGGKINNSGRLKSDGFECCRVVVAEKHVGGAEVEAGSRSQNEVVV